MARGGYLPTAFGDRADVLRRRAAAAADDIDQPLARKLLDLGGHEFRALVILAEFIGQAGIRIGADEGVGDAGNLRQMRAHGVGAERAVQADRERIGMAHRMPERGRRLAGKRAAGKIGDRAGNHDRQTHTLLDENLVAGEDRRLGVQRVEDRLDQDDVGAAVDQPAQLLAIGDAQIVEADGAVAGIVDVRRDRRGAVGRPERAGDEAALAVFLLSADRGAAHQPRAVAVEIVDHVLHAVVGLRDGGGGERVGLEDVGAGDGVLIVDFLDRLRLAQDQQIVVALLVAGAAAEPVAAKMVLVEAEALDLRAHGAVENEDALACGSLQRLTDFFAVRFGRGRTKEVIQ